MHYRVSIKYKDIVDAIYDFKRLDFNALQYLIGEITRTQIHQNKNIDQITRNGLSYLDSKTITAKLMLFDKADYQHICHFTLETIEEN